MREADGEPAVARNSDIVEDLGMVRADYFQNDCSPGAYKRSVGALAACKVLPARQQYPHTV